jgi:hypothetical protein
VSFRAARTCKRALLGGWLCVASAAAPSAAHAQQYLIGADAGLSSGIEAGGSVGPRLTRTRLRLGADLRIDESPEDIIEFGLLAELAPRSGFGADLRYGRAAGDHFRLEAGVLGILAPSSLYGACAALVYRLPISKKAQVELSPEGDFFFLGTDLPDKVVIWQLRLQGGIRVDF